jgi:gamma-glutamylcyclotransferase (GGCT)/AIG2-like uncharacterized protein YtfP
MKEQSKQILFVYGTLRKGFALHSHLKKSTVKEVGEGYIHGLLYDLGEYPGAIETSASTKIIGEVYAIRDQKALEKLDKIEEFNPEEVHKSLFIRKKTTVKLKSGDEISAWVYFLSKQPKDAQLIKSGDYKKQTIESLK